MTSTEIADRIDGFLQKTQEESFLLATLSKLSSTAVELIDASGGVVAQQLNTGDLANHLNRAREKLSNAITEFRKIKPSNLFADVSKLEDAIKEFYVALAPGSENLLTALVDRVGVFRESYDQFIYGYGFAATLKMLSAAQNLYSTLVTNRETLRLLATTLRGERPAISETEDQIAFDFAGAMAYDELIEKLAAFRSAYAEGCRLLNIDAKAQPLRLAKIETGSLHIELVGQAAVFALLIPLIRNLAAFIYRRFTDEGQLRTWIAQGDEILKLQNTLAQALRERGLDDSKVRELTQHSTDLFAEQLGRFFANHPVKINGEQVSVVAKALAAPPSNMPLLPAPNDSAKPTT